MHAEFTRGNMKAKDSSPLKVNERKGNPGSDHWQMDVGSSVFPVGNDQDPAKAFLARRPSMRPTPHQKVNECDH
jgi:hypothetical protein